MILCTAAGYAASRWGGFESGTALGLLAGLVAAPLMPLPKPRD